MTQYLNRKPNRLKNYDYSSNGAYFVTICTKGRREILGEIVGSGVPDAPAAMLSEYGYVVRNQIDVMKRFYCGIIIDTYIIMPNHIHLTVVVQNAETRGASRTPHPTNATLPKLISGLKRFVNKEIGFNIWQASYYDHIIRSETEYQEIIEYIDNNPSKWALDKFTERNQL